MSSSWYNCSNEIKEFVQNAVDEMKAILKEGFVGFYLHGSLSMGGFNPSRSDIDMIVVAKRELTSEENEKLATYLLKASNNPYPIEISILTLEHLQAWKHPCFYEFHYSEDWRERYELAIQNEDIQYIADLKGEDPDLAAHLTILNSRGVCIEGPPIKELFPMIPYKDYVASILCDYDDCLDDIEENSVYCVLNIVRVYWYLLDGVISSKQEAGDWGRKEFTGAIGRTIEKAYENYAGMKDRSFEKSELSAVREYFRRRVKSLINYKEGM
ncbi:aminoglycoside adenylyltransferase domain-containing protein [Alkalihalobacillus sp. CinArs1]|uniref:aminoglycoside adenylyltransferase domain-containing protein n=1 Tax=Alkalihalobacillus sp. CinArs1 TaxID=2995314 RepID=UPI0022DD6640|nr:aminoglycoside adenylyltransferase domain-containing protein [Alkalihalobacillus sp. CinArs1]